MQIHVKRIYDDVDPGDGYRVLIDRLWPRGISKTTAQISYWAKDIAPSTELRRWYQHDPQKWPMFRDRYFTELDANPDRIEELRSQLESGVVTLIFSSKETKLNNAWALKEYLEARRTCS